MNPIGFLLFDIDGVIRDVSKSYRLAIQETVIHFCNWKPSINDIDNLKAEGKWNNDWHASLELINRHNKKQRKFLEIPSIKSLIKVFNTYYFGNNPNSNPEQWDGFIQNEQLLVNKEFFDTLTKLNLSWGFVSGAESISAKYVLETRLKIKQPYLIAMEDAPDKPDPTGLIKIAQELAGTELGDGVPPVIYLGDTVADVLTIKNAQLKVPSQKFISFAISPPHLHKKGTIKERSIYEENLKKAGADKVILNISEIITEAKEWL
ncbi:TIGR01548 family HAD-type hydrolase [Prochlorococcus sp. MIT 1223]|uniref:TIGR01548 family HAD-type hydrolase n=1 Tax=Prochlorococcus sp. MIT 1223 TaxID=3096217 RepID=UPI002A760D58|nr:TIGR01548 family HAD-type hydrolase [Prochlorococcus sp. MIT 1223]